MTPRQVLAECARRGVTLWAEGENLRYRAPRGALTDDLRAAIREHKAELLRLLARDAAGGAEDQGYERPASMMSDGTCYACGQAEWWLSPAGPLVCGTCHPPATPEHVRSVFHREVVRYVH